MVEGGQVKGVVIATPEGRGAVLCQTVIDGTGHADVAAAAGAECMYTGGDHLGIQGAGLPQSEPGATYINTDWTFIDESDMIDVWSAYLVAKEKYPGAYDLGQLIDTRDRRRIVGDYILTPLDIVNRRTFPDTVGISNGGRLDKHGYTVHAFYMINNWRGGMTYTPYRCLLPKGIDGVLVIGVGLSADCDAIPSIRMQPGVQNLGYAAGVAAAMAAKAGVPARAIDIKALQTHLVGIGCLTAEVLEHEDSFPLADSRVRQAVRKLAAEDYSGLGVIMASEDRSIRWMREAHRNPATPPAGKLRCACARHARRRQRGRDAHRQDREQQGIRHRSHRHLLPLGHMARQLPDRAGPHARSSGPGAAAGQAGPARRRQGRPGIALPRWHWLSTPWAIPPQQSRWAKRCRSSISAGWPSARRRA